MTGQIIEEGAEAFIPAINKVSTIFQEFSIYFIYIAVACLGVYLMYQAVKMIIRYIQDNVLYKTRDKRRKASRNMKRRHEYNKRKNNNEEFPF